MRQQQNLVNVSRCQLNAQLNALNTSNASQLAALITAASAQIEGFCHRLFSLNSYTEYRDGGSSLMDQPLALNNFPIVSVQRLATCPVQVLTIQNTSAAVQRATVATTEDVNQTTCTGLTLISVASAVTTTTTLSTTTYPTIAALATAINGAGSGWTATVNGNYGLWASADLKSMQGAVSAINSNCGLELYTEDWQPWVSSSYYAEGARLFRIAPAAGEIAGMFPQGVQNIRIDYTAGFADGTGATTLIPADVQEACVQLVVHLNNAGAKDFSIAAENLQGVYSQRLNPAVGIPGPIKAILSRYVAHDRIGCASL